MKAITRNKWFLLLLGVLMLANVGLLLSFFVFGEKSGHPSGGPSKGPERSYLARELTLNAEQEKKFQQSKEQFFEEMKPLWESIRESKDSFYRNVNNPSISDAEIRLHTARIAELSQEADQKTLRHFQVLRDYCTPEQRQKFDTLVPRMLSTTGSRRGKK
jgi:Spy/CpxP family protein refolding chaperone